MSNKSTGNCSTGNCSTGHYSTGHFSTGHYSTGDCSTGNFSTGHYSTGNCSTGNCSTGHFSTGHYSTGDYSTGHFSTGDYSTGHFSTESPGPTFFDLPAPDGMSWEEAASLIPLIEFPVGAEWVDTDRMTDAEKSEHPNHKTIGGFLRVLNRNLREAFPIAWKKLSDETRQRFLDLPNFDAEKFLAITGVEVREVKTSPPSEVIVDGHRYVLASGT